MKKKILLVDDKQEFLQLTKLFLSRNFEIETAENGLMAIKKLQTGYMPDLIVSDLIMPLVDGKTFVTQISASGIFKKIPVIILSSIEKSSEKIDLLKSGASDYMVKPFNPEELEVRIIRLLKNVA